MIDDLRDDLFNAPPPRVAVWGRSMGAVAALLYAAEKARSDDGTAHTLTELVFLTTRK